MMKIGVLNLEQIEKLGNDVSLFLSSRSGGTSNKGNENEDYYIKPVKKDSILERYINHLNVTDLNK